MVLPKTRRFTVQVRVKHATGMGFAGTGAGWTSPTHAVPMCHPRYAEEDWPEVLQVCGVPESHIPYTLHMISIETLLPTYI